MSKDNLIELKNLVQEIGEELHKTSITGSNPGLNAAALEELRFSFLAALSDLIEDKNGSLEEARRRARAAMYDCYSVEVLYCLKSFQDFAKVWQRRPVVISEVKTEWPGWCQVMDDLQHFSENVPKDKRHEHIEAIANAIKIPRQIVSQLRYVEESLKKKEQQQRKSDFWARFGAVAGTLAIITAICVYFLQKFDNEEAKDKKVQTNSIESRSGK